MGYKLAGFDVIGANEIDPRMASMYKANHNPKYLYVEPIQTFKNRKDLPSELYNLDILDGSPPCSSFSMAGARDKQWGKEKKFREGQAKQILDTLFFDFIDLAKLLQPKVVIAENVRGILLGKAMEYTKKIIQEFDRAGYYCSYELLNAVDLGVPQFRQRVFFYAVRKDLTYPKEGFGKHPKLDLSLKRKPITFDEFYIPGRDDRPLRRGKMYECWKNRKQSDNSFGDTTLRLYGRASGFTRAIIHGTKPVPCITATGPGTLYKEFRNLNKSEACCAGTFPQDYDFKKNQYLYVIGMSVPPLMTKYVATQVHEQILSKNHSIKYRQYVETAQSSKKRKTVWTVRSIGWLDRKIDWKK